MPDYFLAPAGLALWEGVRGTWPNRPAESDGWLGDASHQARASDHNPCWTCAAPYYGIVRAVDLDVDGWPATEFRDWLIARCKAGLEKRLWYVINNRTIWSSTFRWEPRTYTGENPHLTHIHFSLRRDSSNFDASSWLTGFGRGGEGEDHEPLPPPDVPVTTSEEDEMFAWLKPGEGCPFPIPLGAKGWKITVFCDFEDVQLRVVGTTGEGHWEMPREWQPYAYTEEGGGAVLVTIRKGEHTEATLPDGTEGVSIVSRGGVPIGVRVGPPQAIA